MHESITEKDLQIRTVANTKTYSIKIEELSGLV